MEAITYCKSGEYSLDSWDISLKSAGAKCSVSGITEISSNMRHGAICKINHKVGGSHSSQEFRHILRDSSYAMYDGDSIISKGAFESKSSQISKAILLSSDARILNKPRLNIYNSDVKATHGATVGKLDPESVFYLKQRGYTQDLVEQLLLDGFRKDILDRIKNENIRELFYDKR